MLAPPKVVIEGPNQTDVGSSVSIRCNVLEGYPPPTVSITTPQQEDIKDSMIIFEATMKDSGNYTCVANNSVATVTTNLSLTVNGMKFFCRRQLLTSRVNLFLLMYIANIITNCGLL